MTAVLRVDQKSEGRIWPRIDSGEGGAMSISPFIDVCVASRLSGEPGAVHVELGVGALV